MKQIISRNWLVLLGLVFNLMSCQQKEPERDITAQEVPPAVLQVFNQAYPNAAIKNYAEETEQGQKFYEISCEFQGRKIDALYKPDGTVAAIEEVIAAEQLPENIQRAVATEFQQFSIKLTEKIEKEGKTFFEIKLLNSEDQKNYELVFDDAGKLMAKEPTTEE